MLLRAFRWSVAVASAAVALFLAALFFWPVPIEPVGWTPPSRPPDSVAGTTPLLSRATVFEADSLRGPEDLVLGPDGFLYTGTADGTILRVNPETGGSTVWASLPPSLRAKHDRKESLTWIWGLGFDRQGRLLACVEGVGIVSFSPGGGARTIVDSVDSRPLIYPNELAVADDGTIYFTELTRNPLDTVLPRDFYEHRPTGGVFAIDADSQQVVPVEQDLHLANGIVLAPDGGSLLVAENTTYSIRRIWLDGSGRPSEVFASNLPGIPDNLSVGSDGLVWSGLPVPRSDVLDWLQARPFWMAALYRLDRWASWLFVSGEPPPLPTNIMAFDHEGNTVHHLRDPSGSVISAVTSVIEDAGILYVASPSADAIARLDLRTSEIEDSAERRVGTARGGT